MSSYHDTFGNGPENYDDDPDGVEVERRELEDDIARNPEAYGETDDLDDLLTTWLAG